MLDEFSKITTAVSFAYRWLTAQRKAEKIAKHNGRMFYYVDI